MPSCLPICREKGPSICRYGAEAEADRLLEAVGLGGVGQWKRDRSMASAMACWPAMFG
jgi:hypothetical protein